MCVYVCVCVRLSVAVVVAWTVCSSACVYQHVCVRERCCRHISAIRPNVTWQLWITLLAIQGFSLTLTHTHTEQLLLPKKKASFIEKINKLKRARQRYEKMPWCCHGNRLRNVLCEAGTMWIRPCFSLFLRAFFFFLTTSVVVGFILQWHQRNERNEHSGLGRREFCAKLHKERLAWNRCKHVELVKVGLTSL